MQMRPSTLAVEPGSPSPMVLGATIESGGVNFAVFSRDAESMTLCLFEASKEGLPSFEYRLDPRLNRTGDIWHVLVPGIGAGSLYLWRADGPYLPAKGHRFNRHKALIDPYAKAISGDFVWGLAEARAYDPESPDRDLSFSGKDDAAFMPKCVVVADDFDWAATVPSTFPCAIASSTKPTYAASPCIRARRWTIRAASSASPRRSPISRASA